MKNLVLCFFILCGFNLVYAQKEARLLRFPAIHENQIVFSYAGDLYTVATTGGIARKMTSHIGYEMFPKFSPDGNNIAFTGQYDGNTEVYLMPSKGGEPKRLTYTATLSRDDISDRMGPNNIVMCWKNDNKTIIYRSRKKAYNDFVGQLFYASVDGGLSKEVPLVANGFCSFSPDDKKLAFSKIFREFRTWKYYKGGMAPEIYIYDFESKQIVNITNNVAQDIFPMWYGDNIYFLSDRDRTMNLFVYNITSKETRKLTNFNEFDIKFPSIGGDKIVFENGGYIYVFDTKTEQYNKINIQLAEDFSIGRNELVDASKFINTVDVSNDGNRIVFGARGDVFTVPAKEGITRNLTQTSGVHDRNAIWSPDGKYIAFISDMTGNDEIYIIKQDGSEKPIQLTKNADTYKFDIKWSPDSKKILWGDKMLRLQYIDINTKEVTIVDKSTKWEMTDFSWSPDSKWISYSKAESEGYTKIFLYDIVSKNKYPVTESWYNSSSAVFSADGKYLYFVSGRDFNPVYSWTEWNHAYIDMNKIYLITLSKETPSLFKPENDEVGIVVPEASNKGTKKKEPETNTDASVTVKVDIDGILDRTISLPIIASSYGNITALNDGVYYIKKSYQDKEVSFIRFDYKTKKETILGNFNWYKITSDNKKMLISSDGKYSVIDVPKAKIELSEFVNISDIKIMVNRKEEWKQIYDESWRQIRDFFYDPNMHGVNWSAMHKKYEPLVEYVNRREDLTYIIGELIGELNVGHAYTGGGDVEKVNKIKLGLLGAEVSQDKSGYYKIEHILKGENWDSKMNSPLTEIGINVKEGDFIIAVNGKETKSVNDIYSLFIDKADKQVELTVNSTPSIEGSRKVIIVPISSESGLYYYNWVQENIRKVNEASGGKIGYIHIPNMGPEGLNEFVKYFYPQLRKKALIIDDRGNGGGNVSPMIIERLQRELQMGKMSRNSNPSTSPEQVHLGPKVCLINQYSASDGDLFPYRFKKLGIGKVIGVRSWGGVVGIRGSLPFIDGGNMTRPEFAHFDAEGKDWIIEGHGVDPDIVIDNDPSKEFLGIDEQLNKAIEVLLEELKTKEKNIPAIPPFPDKSK